MLIKKTSRTSWESNGLGERPMRSHRRFVPRTSLVRSGGTNPTLVSVNVPSAQTVRRLLQNRRRPVRRRRNGRTVEDTRARRVFCLGILALLNAAVSASEVECDRDAGVTAACTDLYSDSFRSALTCTLGEMFTVAHGNNRPLCQSSESGDARAVFTAAFGWFPLTPIHSRFPSVSGSQHEDTRPRSSNDSSGMLACVGSDTKTMCTVPLPCLAWNIYRYHTAVIGRTSDRSVFRHVHYHFFVTDSESHTFFRTSRRVNGQIIIVPNERISGGTTFWWSANISLEAHTSLPPMALFIRSLSRETLAPVLCIVGMGDNISSPPVMKCRHTKEHLKTTEGERRTSQQHSCIHRYVFPAVCSISLMLSVYALTHMYIRQCPDPTQ
ncbi:pr164 [rat cytomegalovirus strain Maastricht]|uniref:Pr164 n=1 Tax=Rat cytomegalovirus (strain Maastricht) TaxID=79700 RepID=Q9DW29_RCMVM|nr:pr164 [rat cytomegalovirus strain Maastricht]AAF99261.1 pr164 [rat cytomegalovirus strain Maastricht]WEG72082.1 protein m164 [Murid betaherpesvirus 2]